MKTGKLIGCGSHCCIIAPPEGTGNNGPCRCADWRGQRYILQCRKEIADLKDKLAVAEENLDEYISSKEIGLDRGLFLLKQALATIRVEDK